MSRPGIVVYFDIEPAVSMLSDAEAGQLLKAALGYGHYGVVPSFEGKAGLLSMAWSFIRPKLDRDNAQYEKTISDRRYAAYCSHTSESDERLSREEWEMQQSAPASTCQQVLPTTTVTPTSKSSSSGTTTTTTGGSKGGGGLLPLPEPQSGVTNDKRNRRLSEIDAIMARGLGSG